MSAAKGQHPRQWGLWKREPTDDGSSFIVDVENWGAVAHINFALLLVLAIILDHNVVDLENNPIMKRYGGNSICIYIDEPPFSLFAAALYAPIICMFACFSILKGIRVRLTVIQKYGLGNFPKHYYAYLFNLALEITGACAFTQAFATQPTQNEFVHGFSYVLFQLSMTWAAFSLATYYILNCPEDAPWKFLYLYLFITTCAFLSFNILFWNAWTVDEIGGKGIFFIVNSPFGQWFGWFTQKFLFLGVVLMPLILLVIMERYVPHLKITFAMHNSGMALLE